jgi:hypothetical protein
MTSPCAGRLSLQMEAMDIVEVLARLQLVARRHGFELRVVRASEGVGCLIELTGLSTVLALEPRRQSEQREQRLGVEEKGQLDDSAA